jgi:hypothetical protein
MSRHTDVLLASVFFARDKDGRTPPICINLKDTPSDVLVAMIKLEPKAVPFNNVEDYPILRSFISTDVRSYFTEDTPTRWLPLTPRKRPGLRNGHFDQEYEFGGVPLLFDACGEAAHEKRTKTPTTFLSR